MSSFIKLCIFTFIGRLNLKKKLKHSTNQLRFCEIERTLLFIEFISVSTKPVKNYNSTCFILYSSLYFAGWFIQVLITSVKLIIHHQMMQHLSGLKSSFIDILHHTSLLDEDTYIRAIVRGPRKLKLIYIYISDITNYFCHWGIL